MAASTALTATATTTTTTLLLLLLVLKVLLPPCQTVAFRMHPSRHPSSLLLIVIRPLHSNLVAATNDGLGADRAAWRDRLLPTPVARTLCMDLSGWRAAAFLPFPTHLVVRIEHWTLADEALLGCLLLIALMAVALGMNFD